MPNHMYIDLHVHALVWLRDSCSCFAKEPLYFSSFPLLPLSPSLSSLSAPKPTAPSSTEPCHRCSPETVLETSSTPTAARLKPHRKPHQTPAPLTGNLTHYIKDFFMLIGCSNRSQIARLHCYMLLRLRPCLKDVCLLFALFKLLQRRLVAHSSLVFTLNVLLKDGEAERGKIRPRSQVVFGSKRSGACFLFPVWPG